MKLTLAGNSDTACLQAILDKGYEISVKDRGDWFLYIANKDDLEFSATNGPEVLGLISLYEMYGKEWKDCLDKLPYDKIKHV